MDQRFRDAFECSPFGAALATCDGSSLVVNRAFTAFFGVQAQDLAAVTGDRSDGKDETKDVVAYLASVASRSCESGVQEVRCFRRPDGTEVWADVTGTLLPSREGNPECCFIVVVDITGRKAEQAVSESLLAAIDTFSERVVLYDSGDRLVFANKAFREVNKAVSETLVPGVAYETYLRAAVAAGTMPDAAGQEEAWITWRLERHRNPSGPLELRRDNGSIMRVHEEQLPQGGSVTIATDITAIKSLEEELRRLATSDPLTEVANRRFFFDRANAEWERLVRYGRPLAVLMLDIDHFKRINDRYGHPVGDKALKEFTQTLGAKLRINDLLGRLGGEEFAILLPETSLDHAVILGERLRAATAAIQIDTAQGSLSFTASIGIAACVAVDGAFEHSLARADAALYVAKQSGRNRVVVASESADQGPAHSVPAPPEH